MKVRVKVSVKRKDQSCPKGAKTFNVSAAKICIYVNDFIGDNGLDKLKIPSLTRSKSDCKKKCALGVCVKYSCKCPSGVYHASKYLCGIV